MHRFGAYLAAEVPMARLLQRTPKKCPFYGPQIRPQSPPSCHPLPSRVGRGRPLPVRQRRANTRSWIANRVETMSGVALVFFARADRRLIKKIFDVPVAVFRRGLPAPHNPGQA